MIDRDQLTEALGPTTTLADLMVLKQAARILLDFPTDEMVEAFIEAAWSANPPYKNSVRAGLEAVRRSMIGEEA